MQLHTKIYTDGASSGNPGPGGWGAIICIEDIVTELGGSESRTTNNRMELMAVLRALKFVLEEQKNTIPITLYTDSSYVANGITTWIKGWQKRNWTNQVGEQIANVDLWRDVSDILPDFSLKIIQISGHSGIPGNERADEIATGFIRDEHIFLYHGPLDGYTVNINQTNVILDLKKEKDRKNGKAFSYVSLIDGIYMIHSNWDECKKRVNGIKGAKFKKALSKDDEDIIKRSWGLK